jgi:multiple sugar transport system substrate-binding protein
MERKTMNKRIVLFVILSLFAMAGTQVSAQETTITFLTPPWGVPPDAEALAAFTAESGITVEIQSVQMDELYSNVQIASASGLEAADVIFLSEDAPSNVVAPGSMEPLNAYMEASEIDWSDFQNVDFWTIDGNVYGITTYVQLVMMDYDAQLLADAGFDAPATTWAEVYEQAQAIKEQGVEEYPIAFGAIGWSWFLMALSMGDPMFDADLNPVFADEGSKAREAMALLLTFFEEELISPEVLAGSINQHQLFWSGTGVYHQAWQGSVRVGNNPDVSQHAPNVEYALLPEVGNTWSQDAAIGIDINSDAKDAAWTFIEWYVGEANQEAIYNAVGLIPSRTSVQESLSAADAIQGYDVIVEQAGHVNQLPRYVLWWGPFATVVDETILQAAQGGAMTADEVIDTLAQEWNDLKAEFE